MAITQETHWDNIGTEPGAGDAEYVAGDQPVSEWDNWFNWSAAKDVENLIAALENVTTGHDHDGANSKPVDGSDVVNTPAGNISSTNSQAALNELDTEKETPAGAQTKVDTHAADTSTHGVSGDIQGSEDKDVANGIAGLDASAQLGEALFPGIFNKYVASENVYEQNLYSNSTTSTTYEKLTFYPIGVLFPNPATLRVKFQLRVSNAITTAYGQIYKNGTPHGTERSTQSLSYVTFSEDLSFAPGDEIQVYVKSVVGAYSAQVYNLAIHGDAVEILLGEAIVDGAVGLPNPLTFV